MNNITSEVSPLPSYNCPYKYIRNPIHQLNCSKLVPLRVNLEARAAESTTANRHRTNL